MQARMSNRSRVLLRNIIRERQKEESSLMRLVLLFVGAIHSLMH